MNEMEELKELVMKLGQAGAKVAQGCLALADQMDRIEAKLDKLIERLNGRN